MPRFRRLAAALAVFCGASLLRSVPAEAQQTTGEGTSAATRVSPEGGGPGERQAASLESAELAVEEPAPVEAAKEVEETGPVPGMIEVLSEPSGATVIVDGAPIGTTPLRGVEADPGIHEMRIEGRDGAAWEDRFAVPPDRTVRISVSLPGGGVSPEWFWAVAGTAAAAGVAMVATGAYAMTLQEEYDGAGPARQDEIRPTGQALADATDVLLGVGSAAAIAAAVLFFYTDFEDIEPGADIVVLTPEQVFDSSAFQRVPEEGSNDMPFVRLPPVE